MNEENEENEESAEEEWFGAFMSAAKAAPTPSLAKKFKAVADMMDHSSDQVDAAKIAFQAVAQGAPMAGTGVGYPAAGDPSSVGGVAGSVSSHVRDAQMTERLRRGLGVPWPGKPEQPMEMLNDSQRRRLLESIKADCLKDDEEGQRRAIRWWLTEVTNLTRELLVDLNNDDN